MSYSASQSFSKYYYLSITKKTCAETETKLDSISSIWDNDHILRLDEKNAIAYGVINVSKELML